MIRDGALQTKDGEIHSFLMIGQSNMAGRGEFQDVAPIENEACFMLRMGRWQKMREPINPDRPIFEGRFHSGVSLGTSFADRIASETGERVGMIPCADGGTALREWMPGEVLFDHAVMMTRLAMRSSRLSGILWHQGESDCRSDGVATYKERFLTMITAMRQELGDERLPVLIGELSMTFGAEWKMGDCPMRLNRIFHEIAEELPYCAVVSSAGLPMKPDGLHFSASALRTFGGRYAEAYFDLRKRDSE